MSLPEKFLKPFDAQSIEDGLYEKWLASGLFNPDVCIEKGYTKPDAESFSIVLPPPNVTGTLHTGHAFMLAIEDIMVRYNRMQGKKTLWIPGTDHAAISTESVVVKQLAKEKTTKFELGREEFLKRVNAFAQESRDTIVSQTKKMGASLDWSREAFTLDEQRHHAVVNAFKTMHDDGLIYRGNRIVNWDPKGQTTVSDDEVDHEERTGKLYTFKYSKECPIEIATTRPETKLGDTGIAVHPEGKWKEYIGQEFSFEFAGEPVTVTVIGDEYVDPEFGTGALGVTPAHSQIDFEIAGRHSLPVKQVINEYGKMIVGMEGVKGAKTEIAREQVVAWLSHQGLLIKTEDIKQNISLSQRTKAIIEPLPKIQWWINVNKPIPRRDNLSLKELMLKAVREDGVSIIPDRFEKTYFNWIENLRDWNISRQIWYGHQIPVWYDKENQEKIHVGTQPEGDNWVQDQDTLDTWFSSGLWTFSTLGWPDFAETATPGKPGKENDFANYHPTSVLETGHDIIFFWVARMILMSTYLLGEIPFKTVYMHGMVLDKNGKKMSKSNPETAIDPLEAIQKHGADALRMAMMVGVGPGQDVTLSEDKIKAYSKFANKIWNGARFVLEQTSTDDLQAKPVLDPEHTEYINQWNALHTEITKEMNEFKYYLVSEKLYHFFWHTFADIVIEKCKLNMNNSARYTLRYLLDKQLIALHPFMPFITEEIWSSLYPDGNLLMITPWESAE